MKPFPVKALAFLLCLILQMAGDLQAAPPYQGQAAAASLGGAEIRLAGPPGFVRIDGLDRNLDDILLATQAPTAAVLAIYAEPQAWQIFQSQKNQKDGLRCHALIFTPGPLADQNTSPADFSRIKADLAKNLQSAVGRENRLEGELAGISDHQVEAAKGRLEAFEVIEEGPDYLTYRLESSLELKYKGRNAPRVSRSLTVSSTVLIGGKIINLQIVADPQGPPIADLKSATQSWRKLFSQKNSQSPK